MDFFNYKNQKLFVEDVDMAEIAATYGTPCYVYSSKTIKRHFHAFDNAFGEHPHQICYAVKANSNIAILNLLAKMGAGFDIVSGGELSRVIAAGGNPNKVVFSGVGKTQDEINFALEQKIQCFNVESIPELELIQACAAANNVTAPISLRINPDVDAKSHPYISTGLKENKFGIDYDNALSIYRYASTLKNLEIIGVDCHIGSQLTEIAPFLESLERLVELIIKLEQASISIRHLDLGGGLGVTYNDEIPPSPSEYVGAIIKRLQTTSYSQIPIMLEPGRAIMANAGVLLSKVLFIKETAHKNFAIVDAAMNDLIRPALYNGWHKIIEIEKNHNIKNNNYDVVGPVCETGDFIGKDRNLAIIAGSIIAVRSVGAYGFCMSSNYNSRPKAAEILVDGDKHYQIRARESINELYQHESIPSIA